MRRVLLVLMCAAAAIAVWPARELAARPAGGDQARAPAKKRVRGKGKGKVVRVERTQPQVSSKARLCDVYDVEVATCPREIAAGEIGLVVDGERSYGEASVLQSTRVADACGNAVTWNIVLDVSRLTGHFSYNAVFVLDHRVAENGRTLPASIDAPSGRPDENVKHVLDDDGDDRPDLLVTTFACDARAQPMRGSRVSHTCFDTWVEVRDEWRHARTDQVPTCYR